MLTPDALASGHAKQPSRRRTATCRFGVRTVSLAVVFEYEVDPAGAKAFEAVYGSDGEWARYFAPGEGYLGTELLRSGDGRYLVIDRWRSAADYDAFLDARRDEYAARNETAARLWLRERAVGRFEAG
jgi:heme-degrading monooxygenase HmoA